MAETGAVSGGRRFGGSGQAEQTRSKPQGLVGREQMDLWQGWGGEAMCSEAVRVFVVCAQDEEPLGPARL